MLAVPLLPHQGECPPFNRVPPTPESGWHLNVSLESQHGYGSDGDAPVDGELLQQRATQEGHRKEDIDTGEIRSMYFKQPHDTQRCAEADDHPHSRRPVGYWPLSTRVPMRRALSDFLAITA